MPPESSNGVWPKCVVRGPWLPEPVWYAVAQLPEVAADGCFTECIECLEYGNVTVFEHWLQSLNAPPLAKFPP